MVMGNRQAAFDAFVRDIYNEHTCIAYEGFQSNRGLEIPSPLPLTGLAPLEVWSSHVGPP
jgi:hypothetical protein